MVPLVPRTRQSKPPPPPLPQLPQEPQLLLSPPHHQSQDDDHDDDNRNNDQEEEEQQEEEEELRTLSFHLLSSSSWSSSQEDSGWWWMQEKWRTNVIYFEYETENNEMNNYDIDDTTKERFLLLRALQTGDGIPGGSKSTAGECIPKDYFDDLIFDDDSYDDDTIIVTDDDGGTTVDIDPTCTGCEQVNTLSLLTQLDTFVIGNSTSSTTTTTNSTSTTTTTTTAPIPGGNGTEADYLALFQQLLDSVQLSVDYGCDSRCEACFEDTCALFRYYEHISVQATPGQGLLFNRSVAQVQALNKSTMEIAYDNGIYSTTSCAVVTTTTTTTSTTTSAPPPLGSEACITLSQIGLAGTLRRIDDVITVAGTTCSLSFNGQNCGSCDMDPDTSCIVANCTNVEPGATELMDTCTGTGMDGYFWMMNAYLYNFTPGPGCDSPSSMPSSMPSSTTATTTTMPSTIPTTTNNNNGSAVPPTTAPVTASSGSIVAVVSSSSFVVKVALVVVVVVMISSQLDY
jgi:hypothetical protein